MLIVTDLNGANDEFQNCFRTYGMVCRHGVEGIVRVRLGLLATPAGSCGCRPAINGGGTPEARNGARKTYCLGLNTACFPESFGSCLR
jgi:hypothetical protein